MINKLKNWLIKYLTDLGGEREENSFAFEKKFIAGGSVMTINGQRINNPGRQVIVTTLIEIVGKGSMKDIEDSDNSSLQEFLQVHFNVKQDNGREMLDEEDCFYPKDKDKLQGVINQLLNA